MSCVITLFKCSIDNTRGGGSLHHRRRFVISTLCLFTVALKLHRSHRGPYVRNGSGRLSKCGCRVPENDWMSFESNFNEFESNID